MTVGMQGSFMTGSMGAGDAGLFRERLKRHSLQVLTAHETDKLALFYLGLNGDERRKRFSAAVSDWSIRRYCQAIDWQRSILIGRGSVYLFDAVLEMHPMSSGWDAAELVLTCPLLCAKPKIYSRLLQLAALLAGQQGCRNFLVMRDGCDPDVAEMLASMGSVQTGDDT